MCCRTVRTLRPIGRFPVVCGSHTTQPDGALGQKNVASGYISSQISVKKPSRCCFRHQIAPAAHPQPGIFFRFALENHLRIGQRIELAAPQRLVNQLLGLSPDRAARLQIPLVENLPLTTERSRLNARPAHAFAIQSENFQRLLYR